MSLSQAGNTVLAFAASKGFTPICRILLQDGKANPNYKNEVGQVQYVMTLHNIFYVYQFKTGVNLNNVEHIGTCSLELLL